jgi:hypothetical protein
VEHPDAQASPPEAPEHVPDSVHAQDSAHVPADLVVPVALPEPRLQALKSPA